MEVSDYPDDGAISDLEEEFGLGPPKKSVKLSGSELYKPPTAEELNVLRDTDMLFHSNLIKLQVSELLKEVDLPDQKRKRIDAFLHTLHDVIMKLPSIEKFKCLERFDVVSFLLCCSYVVEPLSSCRNTFDNVKVPFHLRPLKGKGCMSCSAPADIQVAGSYLLHTNLKQKLNIDLVLELPKDSMQEKDFLNQRYLRKRAVFLAYIAHYLKDHDLISNVEFGYFLENPQKPVLLLTPSGKLSTSVTVRVHTCPGKGFLKQERFHPSKSNVRLSWFTGLTAKEDDLQPTPYYNSLILGDILMVDHLNYMYELLAECEGIRDGIKLLKVWLRQREFDQGQGCFNGFILSMVVTYLLETRKINKMMSSYQIVRNTLQFLSVSDWTIQGISMNKSVDIAEFHKYFEVVFVDPTGTLNLCYDLSSLLYNQVRQEARLSLMTLDNKMIANGFEAVFMTPLPFTRTFDHILRISKPWLLKNSCDKLNLQNELASHGGNAITCTIPHIARYLKEGLGSRVTRISYKGCQYGSWSVVSDPPQWKSPTSALSFGLLLSSDATSIIDKGPAAETPEAVAFREFWGDKSDLRRFQDGAICEAVVWDCKSKAEKRNLPQKICKHILNLHFGLPGGSLSYLSDQVETILHLKTDQTQEGYIPMPGYVGTGDEINLKLVHSYNELCSHLRNLKDLPLTVVSLQGTSPALRYTEVYPPTQVYIGKRQVMKKIMKKVQIPDGEDEAPPYVHPIEIICHLEGSGKWPQEAEALRRLKAAFHITFAEELQKAFENLTCVPTQNFIDIFKDGFVFRVVIAYHREVTVLQTFTTSDGLVKTMNTPQSIELEERTVHMPRIASALHGLVQRNASFGLTCRLAKRWINGHLLSNHVPEVVTELLCAALYTNSNPYPEPKSAFVGLHRFLWLMATFDFTLNPVIVNLNDEFKESEMKAIAEHFKTYRDSLPEIFIATPKDKTKSIWTRRQPTPIIVRRLKGLAELSLKNLQQKMLFVDKAIDFRSIFSGSLTAYDVVINLQPKCVARAFECCQDEGAAVDQEEDLSADNARVLPVVGFDPVKCYLHELESSFGEAALFFHNVNGGKEICVLWRPDAFETRGFKVASCLGRSLVNENKVAFNVNSIIEEFRVLGKGLVKDIELRTDKWKI